MECKKIKHKLSAYQDRYLPDEDMQEIQHHLKICTDCQKDFAELNFVWEILDQVDKFESAPFFWTQLSQKLNEGERQKSFVNPFQWIPGSVLSMAVVIFAFFIGVYFGKTIFHQSTSTNQAAIEQEVNGFSTVNSWDEYTGESLTDAYVSLISENSQYTGVENE